MKKNIFIFVLLIMIGIKSYSQGVWDKVEVVTDKFHNIKQSVLVHCTAGEIDAVWYEDEQMLKYIGKFPPMMRISLQKQILMWVFTLQEKEMFKQI